MRLNGYGVALALLFALPSGAAHAQPVEQTVEQHRDDLGEIDRRGAGFAHRSSGYVFPAALGAMPARKTITFAPKDAEVYYTLNGGANGDAWISLYVYPASLSLQDEKKGVEAIIVKNYAAKAISRPTMIGAPPANVVEGWFAGSIDGAPIVTGDRISLVDGWNIKVRVTVPVAGGNAALDRAAAGLAAIPMNPANLTPIDRAPPGVPSTEGIVAVR
jgi:hypothetical protein